jgi:hypothetical protein
MKEKTKNYLERKFAIATEATKYGVTRHVFENNTLGELLLPRPTENGKRSLAPKEQFIGDDYYDSLVRTGHLRKISTLHEQLLTEIPPAVKEIHPEATKVHSTEQLLTESPSDGITLI